MLYTERTFSPARIGESYQANSVRRDSGVLHDFIDLIYRNPPAPQKFVEHVGREAIQKELLDVMGTPAFWDELGQDIDSLEEWGSLDAFINYFHPTKNKNAKYIDHITITHNGYSYEHHEWEPGKYWGYTRAFQLAQLGRFDERLQFYRPNDVSDELLSSVEATQRKILALVNGRPPNATRLRERLLENRHFWADFADALLLGYDGDNFKDFLYTLKFGEKPWYKGEGPEMYQYLKNTDLTKPSRWPDDKKEEWERNRSLPPRQRYTKPLYDAAPVDIKLQLRSMFPKDFGEISIDEVSEILALPTELGKRVQNIVLVEGIEETLTDQPTAYGVKPDTTFTEGNKGLRPTPIAKERPSRRIEDRVSSDIYTSPIAEPSESAEVTLQSVIKTSIADLPKKIRRQIEMIDRLQGVGVEERKALLAFSVWQEEFTVAAMEQVGKALGLNAKEVSNLVERVITEEELETVLNTLEDIKRRR